jgi:hypothetical protein
MTWSSDDKQEDGGEEKMEAVARIRTGEEGGLEANKSLSCTLLALPSCDFLG